MARLNSFAGLSQRLRIPFQNILVQCCFCGGYMTEYDKVNFDFKKLGLLLQDQQLLGACTPCCRQKARADVLANTSCVCEADCACLISGANLCDLAVRCSECLQQLTLVEKVDCLCARVPLRLVRGVWRAPCRICSER
nr:early protein 1 [Felis catus papillomavirus]